MMLGIFISSVQKELAQEREALCVYLRGDALLRRFFEPFLFEELPAADRRADACYKDFVLSKIDLWTGDRSQGVQVPTAYEVPQEVVAEAIVNAVCHRDYTSNASVQVMLFKDRLEIWNPGHMPPGLTLVKLIDSGVWVTTIRRKSPEVIPEVRLARVLVGEMTRQRLQQELGLKDDEHFRKAYLLPALEAGLIEMTISDKPRSSRQMYRLTATGRALLANGGQP